MLQFDLLPKYLRSGLFAVLLCGCTNKNEFDNHKFKVVSAAEILSFGDGEIRFPLKMLPDRALIWSFGVSELQIITYDDKKLLLNYLN
jgi:hypothetical protein